MRIITGVLIAVLALAGCGDGASNTPSGEPSSDSSSATGASEAVFAESEDCREALSTVSEIVEAMTRPNLSSVTFEGQVERINGLADRAQTTCSNKVMKPLRMALYEWSFASLFWICPGKTCDVDEVTNRVTEGLAQAQDAVAVSEAAG